MSNSQYTIVVDPGDPQMGRSTYGCFTTEQAATDYAMSNRSILGLDRCVFWHVENMDA